MHFLVVPSDPTWIVPCQVYSCHKCICKSVVLLTVNEFGMINLYSTRFSNQSILLLFIFYLSLGGGGGGPGGTPGGRYSIGMGGGPGGGGPGGIAPAGM